MNNMAKSININQPFIKKESLMINNAFTKLSLVASTVILLSACAPEVGSEAWCTQQAEKPKGDWSTNEATDYTKHCLLK